MTEPHPIADEPTPLPGIDVPPATRQFVGEYIKREVGKHASETLMIPEKLAHAMREIERLEKEKAEAERKALEAARPVLTWLDRNKKLLIWLFLGGGGGTTAVATVRAELQEQAEAAVLERQAAEHQAAAVTANTAATAANAAAVRAADARTAKVETKVEENAELTRTVMEILLDQPRTKKRIKSNPALKAKAEAAVGSLD